MQDVQKNNKNIHGIMGVLYGALREKHPHEITWIN